VATRNPRWPKTIHSFNGGEISPRVYGRMDLDKYDSSVQTLLNFAIHPEGGLAKRTGSRFVKPLQDGSLTARLIPFMFSTTQGYMLEFGLNYIKFFRDEGAILNTAQNITFISQASPASVTIAAHGYENGEEVFITGVVGMTELNGRYFTIANKSTNTFELQGEDSTSHTAYTSGGTGATVHTVTTTYTQAEVEELEFAQSSDTLYIAHQAHKPAQLTRTGHTSWVLADAAFVDGPYLTENFTTNAMDNSAASGSITIDADAVTNINGGLGFQASTDIGRVCRIRHEQSGSGHEGIYDYGHAIITAVNTTIQVDADVINEFAGTGGFRPQKKWRLGAFYLTNYPAAVSFGDGRLWWGGAPDKPGSVYGSKSGEFLLYAPSTYLDDVIADAAAISYTIGVNQVNEVKWISSGRTIVIGTPGGVLPLQASSNNEPITPFNINVPSPTTIRAAAIHPAVVGDTVVFITRAQNEIRAIRYALDQDASIAENLTRLTDHIGEESKFAHVSYAQDPQSTVWCVREDGSLAALTYRPEEGVFAWGRHILGGVFGAGDPVVEKIAAIESPNADHDQVWMIVKRTINGSTVRYVEFFEEEFDQNADIDDAFYVDCGLTYDDAPETTITGLNHLEGETVQVLADGAPVADKTVASGSITLATAASTVQVGYGYNADLLTLPVDDPSMPQQSMGTPKRIHKVFMRVYRTVGGQYGPDSSTLSSIIYRKPGDAMDTPVPLFSGLTELPMDLGRNNLGQLFVRANQPMPFFLTSVSLHGSSGDR